jgi:predicted ATPase
MYVIIITVTLQIIIVSTPLTTVFITVRQNFWEWLFALLVGAGGLGVSAMTKLITHHMQISSSGGGHQHHEELLIMHNSV